jgi:signal transduction histidine kinase/phage shock protein PspC (stress-responsive transcriptional regulator)
MAQSKVERAAQGRIGDRRDARSRAATTAVSRTARPPLRRSRENRMIAGVAAGIAQHLGMPVTTVRTFFFVSAFAAGFGLVVYLLVWMLAPLQEADASQETSVQPVSRWPAPTLAQAMGVVLIAVGAIVLFWVAGFWFGEQLMWPVALAAIGFAVLWARTTDHGRSRWDLSTIGQPLETLTSGEVSLPRVLIGTGLIVAGGLVFLAANTSISAAGNMLLAMLVAVGGIALLAGPWVWQMANQLMEERSSRVRADARAKVAAHLHDSVLQTLALIQRTREPREMASLARTQERELRAWLYGRAPEAGGARLRDAVDEMAGRIEAQQQVPVEAVVVGDAPLDDELRALVAATGEATMNAARHSGAESVAVYVEVEPETVTAFVRDQGSGFAPATVPADRRGIADSIVARMARHGGSATVTSGDRGTEIVIRLPRPARSGT